MDAADWLEADTGVHPKRMIVRLIKAGEPTPVDSGVPRLMRTGNLAMCLARRGHMVSWWTATFDHQRQSFRQLTAPVVTVDPNLQIHFVNSLGYAKNVSLRRWFDDIWLAGAMCRRMRRAEDQPDVIVCAYPLLFVSLAALQCPTASRQLRGEGRGRCHDDATGVCRTAGGMDQAGAGCSSDGTSNRHRNRAGRGRLYGPRRAPVLHNYRTAREPGLEPERARSCR
jgi:hypothetical protein